MSEKVILVLVDGMRPDGMLGCGHPFSAELVSRSSHALDAQTVMPSVTLPCHMSLFHAVDPARHHNQSLYAAGTSDRRTVRSAEPFR